MICDRQTVSGCNKQYKSYGANMICDRQTVSQSKNNISPDYMGEDIIMAIMVIVMMSFFQQVFPKTPQ